MSLHALAGHMATKGRGGDSMLVHMTPEEVQSLQVLALKNGGTLTINPDTGLPEANFLKKLLPAIAGFALGPAGFGLMSAGMAGAAVGGITALTTGSLSRGLMAGLGAYGGASLAGGLANAGTGALSAEAGNAALANAGMTGEAALSPAADEIAQRAVGERLASATPHDKLSAGFKAVTNSPETLGKFAKNNFGALASLASPMLAADTVQTTTKRPDTGYIRNYSFNPYTQQYADAGSYPASEYKGMAQGGIVALANGGATPEYFAANPDVAAAYQQNSYGMSPDQFAQTHYAKYGQAEQRTAPLAATTSGGVASLVNVGDPNYVAQATTTPQQDQKFYVPNTDLENANRYLAENRDVAAYMQSAEGRQYMAANPDMDATDIALTHFNRYGRAEGRTWGAPIETVTDLPGGVSGGGAPIETVTDLPGGVSGGGTTVVNPNGTITTTPNIPGRPAGGFTGMGQVRDVYTQGGGSLGYVNPAPRTMEEFNERFNKQTGDSLAAYEYLMGKGAYPTKSGVEQIMRPYSEVTLGMPVPEGRPNEQFIFDPVTKRFIENPNYRPVSYNSNGERVVGLSQAEILQGAERFRDPSTSLLDANNDLALYEWVTANNISEEALAAALKISLDEARAHLARGKQQKEGAEAFQGDSTLMAANGGMVRRMALGGLGALAGGGATSQYNLGGYSDGGRLLRGPGDGVSDSIPATIGNKQPARLADGEFVVPARIVSELGNGSTEAGARKLYAMMARVQKARGKTTGKNRVAANTRSEKYLPA